MHMSITMKTTTMTTTRSSNSRITIVTMP